MKRRPEGGGGEGEGGEREGSERIKPASDDRRRRPEGEGSERIKPGAELNLQLLHRAYCYLRLCGLEPSPALAGMRASLDALASAEGPRAREAVWARLQASTPPSSERVPSAPPLLRGHMVYP